MTELTPQARALLDRYRAVESIPPTRRARMQENILQLVALGQLPRFDLGGAFPLAPEAKWSHRAWSAPLGKAAIAAALLVVPALALGAVSLARHGLLSEPPSPSTAAQVSQPISVTAIFPSQSGSGAPSEPAVAPIDSVALVDSVTPAAKALAPAKSASLVPHGALPEPTIDGEMSLLNEAQQANQVGDSRRALSLLDEYARRFPSGRLADVRAVARLVALCKLGQVTLERQEADRFQAKYPGSPFDDRVKGICASKAAP